MTRISALVQRALALSVALFALAAPCTLSSSAASPRAYAASYQLLNIVEDGSQVRMTMKLTLMNRTNQDVKGGIVAIMDGAPTPALLSSFGAIKTLPHMNQVTVSHSFSIPTAEYTAWQTGHAPRLQFLVPDGESAVAEDIQSHQVILPTVKE